MIEQGSDEWKQLKLGKASASRVADIMRKVKSGGVSASRVRYLGELVAERLTGVPTNSFKSSDMDWGNQTEPQARDAYEFYMGLPLEAVAFVDHPTIPMAGCSPDRLVGTDGLLEIKCPATHTHIATLLGDKIDPDYMTQMQFQMACTGRQWCDWVSFDPRLPERMRLYRDRVLRDPVRIAEMEAEVRTFLAEVERTVVALQSKFSESVAA
jgi:putative phage-type endonuclease